MSDNPYEPPRTADAMSPSAAGSSNTRARTVASFALALLLGWCVWAFSEAVVEPWDSNTWYYSAALVATGFVATCLNPRRCWPAVLGAYLGQVAYMELFLRDGVPILPSFVGVAIFGVVPVLLGALIPFVGWRVLRWPR